VGRNHSHSEHRDPTRGQAHDQGHGDHAPAKNPNDSSGTPRDESPRETDYGKFEKNQPQAASEEEPGNLLY